MTGVRRAAKIAFGLLGVLAVAVIISSFITLDEYAITPGQASSVLPLISVAPGHARAHAGSVLLTDVELVPLRAVDYLFYRLNGNDAIVPKSEVTGDLTAAQYNTEGVIDMATARQAATVVALDALGYRTTARPIGVAEYAPVTPDAPAVGSLSVGDVITAVDGHPTLSPSALESVLERFSPGSTVKVRFHPIGTSTASTVPITLGSARTSSLGEVCVRANTRSTLAYLEQGGRHLGCLGIISDPIYATTNAPFGVSMNAEGIIGPSAGLAFTLGLIAKLDAADLTGGMKIAATGTMALDGTVGDVGGVAQKTVAVRRAGATIFFVPPQELSVAKAHAGTGLRVFAVANVHQAIADLERLGGKVVRPVGSAGG